MFKKLLPLFIFVIFFMLSKVSLTFAESGCGGTAYCMGEKIYNTYDCDQDGSSCTKVFAGSASADCFASEDDCFAWTYKYSCPVTYCEPRLQIQKSSCCGNVGGGGGGQLQWRD